MTNVFCSLKNQHQCLGPSAYEAYSIEATCGTHYGTVAVAATGETGLNPADKNGPSILSSLL